FPLTVLFPTASGITPEGDHISVMDLVGIPDVPTAGSGTFPSPLVRLVVVMAETERDGGQDVVDPDLLFDPASGWDDKLLKVARRPHVAKHRTLAGRLNGDDVPNRVQRSGQRKALHLVQGEGPDRVLLLLQHSVPVPEPEHAVLIEKD